MKTIKFLLFGAMALFFMASCEKETINVEDNEVAATAIVASTPEDTKAYVDGSSVKWQSGDKLYVFKDGVNNKTWEYTLSEGADKTRGTFTYSGTGSALSEGTAVHALFAKCGDWSVSGSYQFYIESAPTLYGYDGTESTSSDNTLKMPMIASGSIESELAFTHLASLIRINLTNKLDDDVVISSMRLSCGGDGYMAGTMVLKTKDWTTALSGNGEMIVSEGSVNLAKSKDKTFDFVVFAREYSDFILDVITDKGYVYKFKKSSFVVEKGNAYVFNADLIAARKSRKDYYISIDGGENKEFNMGDTIAIGDSIVLKPNYKTTLTYADYSLLLKKNLTKQIDVDLRELNYYNTSWLYYLGNEYVRNLYLPLNVTKITNYYSATQCNNIRLHVSKNLVNIALCQFNYGSHKFTIGSGFYVDADNPSYSSENGILYDKAGTKLLQYPNYDLDTLVVREGVKVLGDYCISNNGIVNVVICPTSLVTINKKNFYKTAKLSTIIVKSATPPELNTDCIGKAQDGTKVAGVIIIDTGDNATDDKAKADYTEAWRSKIGDKWIIKTKAESQL